MKIFVEFAHVTLFVFLIGLAAISGLTLTQCIDEDDAGSAWVWGAVFAVTSFVIAWGFWRLV